MKALTFDVFGTVVDWHGSIVREGAIWTREKGVRVDWSKFAERWRAGYKPALEKVRRGELPWMKLDQIHRMILDEVLAEFQITGLSEEEKDEWNGIWHRLDPWPDAVEGLIRLKRNSVVAALSNGNVSLLVDIAKHAGLPWDAVFSSELFRRYKPDRENYLGAAELLSCRPDQVMMVAAHPSDLKAAQDCGLKTAFVPRPMEHGAENRESVSAAAAGAAETSVANLASAPFLQAAPSVPRDPSVPVFDVTASDFLDLAAQL
ncbi:MAG: haloacid dehalogenase type II [Terracidiphilus sp.]